MAPNSNSSSIYCLINNFSYGLWWYSPFNMGLVPNSAKSSAYIPACYSLVPIPVDTQEVHHGNCVVSHLVGYNAPESH